jgi:hypothetical protein
VIIKNQQEEERKEGFLDWKIKNLSLTFLPSRLPVQSPMAQRL